LRKVVVVYGIKNNISWSQGTWNINMEEREKVLAATKEDTVRRALMTCSEDIYSQETCVAHISFEKKGE
jgi:hypothetical protein